VTDKEFVQLIYPKVYFHRGEIYESSSNLYPIWSDEYGRWAQDWDDQIAINNLWEQFAEYLRREMLRKFES
jgi:hypothetical protein